MKIRPYGGYILVRKEQAAKTIAGGLLHIPEDAQKRQCRGEVLAVGGGRVEEDGVFRETPLRSGERVLWDRMGAHDVPDHDDLALVSAAYVLATLGPTA